jgi:hypothetical protein
MAEAKQAITKQVDQLLGYHAAIAKRIADRDAAIARANETCAEENAEAQRFFEQISAQIEEFCTTHRVELLGDKKSIEINHVKIGFVFDKPLIESIYGKDVNEDVLLQAVMDQAGSTLHSAAEREMLGKCYELKPKLMKNEVKKLPEALQGCLNIRVMTTEEFFLRLPKPE